VVGNIGAALDLDLSDSLDPLGSRSRGLGCDQGRRQIPKQVVPVMTMAGETIDVSVQGMTSLEDVTVSAVKQQLARQLDTYESELRLLHPDDAIMFSNSDRPFRRLSEEDKCASLVRWSCSTTFLNVRLKRTFARGMRLEVDITLSHSQREGQQYKIHGGYRDPWGVSKSVPYHVSGPFRLWGSDAWCEKPAMYINLHLSGAGHFADLQIFKDGALRVTGEPKCSTFSGPSFFEVLEGDLLSDTNFLNSAA
jgi:hypothetical protein